MKENLKKRKRKSRATQLETGMTCAEKTNDSSDEDIMPDKLEIPASSLKKTKHLSQQSQSYPSTSGFQPVSKLIDSGALTINSKQDFKSNSTSSSKFKSSKNTMKQYFNTVPKLQPTATKLSDECSPEITYESLSSKTNTPRKNKNEELSFVPGVEGEDCNKESQNKYFDDLPDDVVEMIFCHLPLHDMLLNTARVCQRWNQIINNEKFLPWKKHYHKIKASDKRFLLDASSNKIYPKMANLKKVETAIINLLSIVNDMKAKPPKDLLNRLQILKDYPAAVKLIQKLLALMNNEKISNWCYIPCLIMLSQTVSDVQMIFRVLLHPNSQCNVYKLVEIMYCVATVLFTIDKLHKVAKGWHYRVFYSLYLYENLWVAESGSITGFHNKGQQSILRYIHGRVRLTHEQMRIVNHPLAPEQIVKIVAFAGTGKSTTLVEYTKLRLGQKFLLISFNKSVKEHATRVFPRNVECRTAHSLAYEAFGSSYRGMLSTKLKPKSIEMLLQKAPAKDSKIRYAKHVVTTIESFINSAEELMTLVHVPIENGLESSDGGYHDANYVNNKEYIPAEQRLAILFDAGHIWELMCNKTDYSVNMMHDGYLKLHQLSKPVITKYDCILVDEAQDCNPAMLDIILRQKCPKILVGDPNQQIYAFRGAVNALESVQCTHTYYLTQSFRFGAEIAYVANTMLDVLKNVTNKTLVGGDKPSFITGERTGQIAFLSRTNTGLFNKVVKMICLGIKCPGDPPEVQGHILGGTAPLNQLMDIYRLMNSNPLETIKDRFIKMFATFKALKAYAINSLDMELRGKILLVEGYAERLPQYIDKISKKCGFNISKANVVFGTVHKAKGLEFDTVVLMDDFNIGDFPYRQIKKEISVEFENELNILYVAITRAKKSLVLNSAVYFVLLGAQEKFEYPILSTEYTEDLECYGQVQCGEKANKSVKDFLLLRRKIVLGDNQTSGYGVLCSKCILCTKYTERCIRHPNEQHQEQGLMNLVGLDENDPWLDPLELTDINRQFVMHIIK